MKLPGQSWAWDDPSMNAARWGGSMTNGTTKNALSKADQHKAAVRLNGSSWTAPG
jgi:hypothetical protein